MVDDTAIGVIRPPYFIENLDRPKDGRLENPFILLAIRLQVNRCQNL